MDEGSLKSVSVLYVEDEDIIRESLSVFLKRRIDTLFLAANGQEGLDAYLKYRPDIIITDIRMPVMDGLEMARQIREIDKEVPILITTAYNDEEYFLRSIDIGIDKYVKKPINNRDLVAHLERLGRGVKQHRELQAKNRLINLILDISPEFMMISDLESVEYLNRSFLHFLGFESLEAFQESQRRINDYIISKKEAFYRGRELKAWLEEVIEQPEREHIVYMAGRSQLKSEANAYLVQAREIPEEHKYLVWFTNVTAIDQERQTYHELSMKDPLTGIFNRKKFDEEIAREIQRAQRYGHPLSMMIFDIDHFKDVNDNYGHQVGDYVLQELARVAKEHIRQSDLFVRYGGEEFIILLPETMLDGAVQSAQKLRKMIAQAPMEHVMRITCSFGVTLYRPGEEAQQFLKRADDALYEAKNNGRDRVEVLAGNSGEGA